MLFPLWLENIVLATRQWLPAFFLSGFALFLWRRRPRQAR